MLFYPQLCNACIPPVSHFMSGGDEGEEIAWFKDLKQTFTGGSPHEDDDDSDHDEACHATRS